MALSGSSIYSAVAIAFDPVFPHTYAATGCVLPANSLIVVKLSFLSVAAASTFSVANTGTALTWTQKAATDSGASSNPVQTAIFVAQNTSGQTVTINVTSSILEFTFDGPSSSAIDISAWTGHDTTTPVGLTAVDQLNGSHTGALNFSLGGTSASDSAIVACVACDGDHGAALVDGGSGYTELFKTQSGTSGWFRATFEYKVGALSSVDFGALNDPYQYAASAIEIKAAGGGGGGDVSTRWANTLMMGI